jgi:hypothetical protein
MPAILALSMRAANLLHVLLLVEGVESRSYVRAASDSTARPTRIGVAEQRTIRPPPLNLVRHRRASPSTGASRKSQADRRSRRDPKGLHHSAASLGATRGSRRCTR